MSRVVFATDFHLTEGQDSLASFAVDVEEIAALSPDLLVMGGDVCLWKDDAGEAMQELLQKQGLEVFYLMGNHDTDREGGSIDFDQDFRKRFGTRNQSVQLQDVRAIGLNTCQIQAGFDDWRNVCGLVGEEDLQWLTADLAVADPALPLLLFVHIPLVTSFPERRNADEDTTNVWRVRNADSVLDRLTHWQAAVVVGQGHLHENEHSFVDGVHLVTIGSVCGNWWKEGARSRCTDDSPRGWMVVDVQGSEVELSYRAARYPAEFKGEIVTSADGASWLNLFFGDPREQVKVCIDGTWVALPQATPLTLTEPFGSTHHWALPEGIESPALRVRTRLRNQALEYEVQRRA